MRIEFWQIGKTKEAYIEKGVAHYQKRLKPYHNVQIKALPSATGKGIQQVDQYKSIEGQTILKHLDSADMLVLLDEAGKQFTSQKFSQWLQNRLIDSPRRLVFLIGGAYGFAPEVYARAQFQLSLSAMTFPHQLVRLFFLEQLYRAFTIIHNKSYHH